MASLSPSRGRLWPGGVEMKTSIQYGLAAAVLIIYGVWILVASTNRRK